MFKISNLNFKEQTIENIEVNGLTINNFEIKLTKTKLNIVVNKETKTQIKKKKNEDIIDIIYVEEKQEETQEKPQEEPQEKPQEEPQEEEQEEPQEEPQAEEEEPQEEEQEEEPKEEEPKEEEPKEEEPQTEKIPLHKMKELLYELLDEEKCKANNTKQLKKNTIDAYFTALKEIYHHFKILDMNELLETKEQDIINYIEETYKEKQTIKVKLCSIYKGYNILRIESLYLKNKIDEYRTRTTIETDKNKEENKKDESEGEEMINTFKNHLEELEGNIKEDTEILTKWKQEAQLYFILKIYLNYGVLRPSEMYNILITDTDENNDKINYINVKTKKIVINNHKNNDKRGTKEFVLDDKLIKGLKAGLGRYLITNEEGNVYESSSSFTKLFKKKFNFNPYDLRRAISSKAIAEGETNRINQLEYIQGHSLNVILQHYNKYSKKD